MDCSISRDAWNSCVVPLLSFTVILPPAGSTFMTWPSTFSGACPLQSADVRWV